MLAIVEGVSTYRMTLATVVGSTKKRRHWNRHPIINFKSPAILRSIPSLRLLVQKSVTRPRLNSPQC